MYKYAISNQYERNSKLEVKPDFIPLNSQGFADILSINLEDTLRIKKAKNKINLINSNLWEDIKKYTNPYELIYIFNNKSYRQLTHHSTDNICSISNIKPLSRSFFKMIEIIHEFIPTLYNKSKHILNSLHIAEGPGGFIEATRYIRNIYKHTHITSNGSNSSNGYCKSDKAFGITLIDNTRKNVPAWKQSNGFLKNHPEVIISTGADGTGNIYNIDNILSLEKLIQTHITTYDTTGNNNGKNYIDFITADGGFDYSIDYNYQEQASSKLIFCEIITALKYQCIGGDFVCKFFDINSYLSIEMLYLLYISYEQITIYKPLTSRIANSEKYIICNNFIGINTELLNNLFNVLNEWNTHQGAKTLNQLFTYIQHSFIEYIKNINKEIIDTQIKSINNIVNIFNTKINMNINWKKENIKQQTNNAIEWCKKYNIPHIN